MRPVSCSDSSHRRRAAAASVLASIPVIAVYIPMQDQLVGGLTSGAVKG